ncbi:MAG: MiaB/RimO family radical SAM methylthiotransferase, partial [bacterium]
AEKLTAQGVKELILVAQDTTIYGQDLYGSKQLVPLLERLSQIDGLRWIRLLYTYPAHFSDALIDVMAEQDNICSYVDLPIQHASDRILKAMARKVKRRDLEQIIDKLRTKIPDIAIRTSLIVGFPGETAQDFREMVDFVERIRFERLGVFTYSREEGTPSYDFTGQVPDSVKRERWSELMDVQAEISHEVNRRRIGTVAEVLVDGYNPETNTCVGRTAWDCPGIDNSIEFGRRVEPGSFCRVRIMGCSDFELKGILVD